MNIFCVHTRLLKSLSQDVRENNLLATVLETVFDNGISTRWTHHHRLLTKEGAGKSCAQHQVSHVSRAAIKRKECFSQFKTSPVSLSKVVVCFRRQAT